MRCRSATLRCVASVRELQRHTDKHTHTHTHHAYSHVHEERHSETQRHGHRSMSGQGDISPVLFEVEATPCVSPIFLGVDIFVLMHLSLIHISEPTRPY